MLVWCIQTVSGSIELSDCIWMTNVDGKHMPPVSASEAIFKQDPSWQWEGHEECRRSLESTTGLPNWRWSQLLLRPIGVIKIVILNDFSFISKTHAILHTHHVAVEWCSFYDVLVNSAYNLSICYQSGSLAVSVCMVHLKLWHFCNQADLLCHGV